MKNEFYFQRKKAPKIVAFAVLLCLELLISSKSIEYCKNSSFVDLILQQSVIGAIFLPVFWKLHNNDSQKFYDDGISYIKIFTRNFLSWNEITKVEIFEFQSGYVFELTAENKKVKVHTAGFKHSNIVEFLKTKLEKFHNR